MDLTAKGPTIRVSSGTDAGKDIRFVDATDEAQVMAALRALKDAGV